MLTGYQWSADGSAPVAAEVAQASPPASATGAPAAQPDEKNALHQCVTSNNLAPRAKLRSLVDRHDLFAGRFANVFAQWAIKPIVFELLEHVSSPAGGSCNRKNRREKIGRNA